MNGTEVTELVKLADTLWTAKPLDAETVRTWRFMLADTAYETARATLIRVAAEPRRFRPEVGEIVAACKPPKQQPLPATCDCGNPACVCICDRGWNEDRDENGYLYARPCRRCRPAAHKLWQAGHWSCPNRTRCPTCKEIIQNGVS